MWTTSLSSRFITTCQAETSIQRKYISNINSIWIIQNSPIDETKNSKRKNVEMQIKFIIVSSRTHGNHNEFRFLNYLPMQQIHKNSLHANQIPNNIGSDSFSNLTKAMCSSAAAGDVHHNSWLLCLLQALDWHYNIDFLFH